MKTKIEMVKETMVRCKSSIRVSTKTPDLNNKGDHLEAPYYHKQVPTKKGLAEAFGLLKFAKPNVNEDFLFILKDRIAEAGFSDKELKEAVLNLIDNNRYPNISIADIVSQKPKIKYYTYRQYGKLCDAEGVEYITQRYRRVDVRDRYGELLFASIEDIERFEIPLMNSKNKLS